MAPNDRSPDDPPEELADGKPLAVALRNAKGWIHANRKRALILGGALTLVLGATVTTWSYLVAKTAEAEETVTLEMALESLEQKQYLVAQEQAQQLRLQANGRNDRLGGAAFVRGAAMAYDTDEKWEKDKSMSYLRAARYLEESRDRGFPPGRNAQGLQLLGRCQYLSQQFHESQITLREALKTNPENKTTIYEMLAEAHLNTANPMLLEALQFNAKYLEDRMLPDERRQRGVIRASQILFRLGRLDDCRQMLTKIPSESKVYGEAIVVQGQLVLHEARRLKNDPELIKSGENLKQAQPKYLEAIKQFRIAQSHDSLGSQATTKSMYLIGACQTEIGSLPAASEQLSRTMQLHHDTEEGLAATLLAADVLRKMKQDDAAVVMYRKAFTAAGDPETFHNRWVPRDQFRTRMLDAYQYYVAQNDFERAGKLLQGFRPMFSGLRTVELTAQTHRQWADALSKQASQLSESEAYPLRRKSAYHMRKAGYTYAQLARFRAASREFPEDIWNAADSLLLGNDYVNAIKMLNEYLKNEHRRLRPQALVGIGKAHLALGNLDESLKALLECIRIHGSDAAIYEARLWCGKAYLEKGELDQAEKLLRDNLNGGTLTPASHEWRDSLFAMGHLLHAAGKHEEAISRLEEAVARYPETRQALEGLYLIAEAYREAAQAPQERLRKATIESVRIAQRRQIRQLLDGARDYYVRVQEKLNRRAETADLTEMETAMLRNCYFSIGSVFFDLGRYEDAITAYSNASTRYQNEPLVLESFMQIANCHRRLNRPLEARGALEQAKVVWKRLDPNMRFTSTTNYNRDEWFELLDRLSKW